jgi:hypothetical protein
MRDDRLRRSPHLTASSERETWGSQAADAGSATPEVGSVPESWDDEQLLAALKESLQAERAVPPEFVEAGKSPYAWRNIDAELASLTYDSVRDTERAPSLGSETASIRALTFTSAHVIIELEVSEESLLGHLIPAHEGTIEIHRPDGAVATVPVDKLGWFPIHPIPASPFRLQYHATDGIAVLTGWITL